MAVIKLGQLLHRATTAPIDENNPLNVALSGNIVQINFGTAVIRTTDIYRFPGGEPNWDAISNPLSIRSQYKEISFYVRNTLNTSVTVTVFLMRNTTSLQYVDRSNIGSVNVPSGAGKFISEDDLPKLNVPSYRVFVEIHSATAPTSGDVSVYMLASVI